MSTRLQWASLQVLRRLWFRATAFSAIAVAAALLATVVEPDVPPGLAARIDVEAVGTLLDIIATSMLSVAIFSLTALVAAHASATSNATPRATRILSEDNLSQNALGTFIGAFIYSLVGIVALQAGLYDQRGRVSLYVVTLAVLAVIVVALLRWIGHVLGMGRVGEITARVEKRTAEVMHRQHASPHLGGTPLAPGAGVPEGAVALYAGRSGHVRNIDMRALQQTAGRTGLRVHVASLPGTYADACRPLAWVVGGRPDRACRDGLREAFAVGDTRTFDQDPRFGMIVLAEIAVRALSPALNDPGTAIDVLERAARLLAIRAGPRETPAQVDYPDVHVPAVPLASLFEDVFAPIARDGAGMAEVGVRLQEALHGLALLGDAELARLAACHSAAALERARQRLEFAPDLERVRQAVAPVQALAPRR
ncbi:DUF2254 domain-containing protein [Lysobacter sp. GX 14042]|uniref:DUF2254 domain-containing protein n=1 Tax=Lysobacter sp. GX 14042 TaxID=2907155 RepID=UPI001F2D9230|nr:DUF2254 domain-containing protein [Lysobacter sp. GX 14042]MCE7032083.1 DUF2254 domain-containing protein [Lysobacter sp. GX 14042]